MFKFSIGFINSYLFFILYSLLTIIVMKFINTDKKKKILTYANYKEFNIYIIFQTFFRTSLIILSFFIPIYFNNIMDYLGIFTAILGILISVYGMWTFSKANLDKPVIEGIYKYSRHPMQTGYFIMWLGIFINSRNVILLALLILFIVFSFPLLRIQEKYCTQKYGLEYEEYLKSTRMFL